MKFDTPWENPHQLERCSAPDSWISLESKYDISDFITVRPRLTGHCCPKTHRKQFRYYGTIPQLRMKMKDFVALFHGFTHFFLVELSPLWANTFISVAKIPQGHKLKPGE
jgi:hypothetical protein